MQPGAHTKNKGNPKRKLVDVVGLGLPAPCAVAAILAVFPSLGFSLAKRYSAEFERPFLEALL
jgi:hypothetical protein